ncbi:MAG: TlyA family rRNA (cytidine-2'-O)-methyltransferase [Deltaproteobacteria bacterium]|nr:TlyA family rRNA (cytidine-2'-O)-methyltransferase [Deltaproteobacteria bacterium]
MRLDQYLCIHQGIESRNKAQQLIKEGFVWVNQKQEYKSSRKISDHDQVLIHSNLQFVSRGGHKLQAALQHFQISIQNKLCIDVGASTGGFTDCMLQAGAKEVLAIDVGTKQLHPSLRDNPRVLVREQTDIRAFHTPPFYCDFLAADLSFISISMCIDSIGKLMKRASKAVLLIKPQFEAGTMGYRRDYIPLGPLRDKVIDHCGHCILEHNFQILGRIPSPISGAKKGNIEELFFVERL